MPVSGFVAPSSLSCIGAAVCRASLVRHIFECVDLGLIAGV